VRAVDSRQVASGSTAGAAPRRGDQTTGVSDRTVDAADGATDGSAADDPDGAADGSAADDIVEAGGDDTDYGILGDASEDEIIEEPLAVRELKAEIAGLETTTRRMLAVYRDRGPETPPDAHVAAGGDGDRTATYAHNRTLRTRGLIEHVGRGYYDYRLREFLHETFDGHADEERIEAHARSVERDALDPGVGE